MSMEQVVMRVGKPRMVATNLEQYLMGVDAESSKSSDSQRGEPCSKCNSLGHVPAGLQSRRRKRCSKCQGKGGRGDNSSRGPLCRPSA